MSTEQNWGVPIISGMRCSGGVKQPTNVWFLSAMASRVKFITGEGQHVPWYSAWENITVACFPLAYSASVQWIAAAARSKDCRAKGWKYCDDVDWHPSGLVVKEYGWYIRTSTYVWVNHDFFSSKTIEWKPSSNRCCLSWIGSSARELQSNQYPRTTDWHVPSSKVLQMLLIFSFKYVYCGA